jgi:hypothetical chaperone protein
MVRALGVDFGTTNSVVASLHDDGSVTTQRYTAPDGLLDVFRSVLCFWSEPARGRSILCEAAGPAAIASYLEDPLDSRLIMSTKTYLAQRSFTETRIFGQPFSLERLIGRFLRALLAETGPVPRVIVGRPVHFAGELADDALGAGRLQGAYDAAGFPEVTLALEPEAAGWRYAQTLTEPATVLIGDFGGGTSDFSVLRFEPGRPALAPGLDPGVDPRVVPLSHAGIGIAGDVFDYRIINHVIAPLLGKGDSYRVMGKSLPVPPEYYSGFARWHLLSLMRTPRTLRAIAEVARTADYPERLRHLIALIEDGLGFALYQAVSGAKAALSRAQNTVLRFDHKDLVIEQTITRADFESWIADDLARLGATVDHALAAAGLHRTAVDRIFLTGGSAFIPAVRRLFAERFGAAKLAGGGEFVSVAEGLALMGAR